MGFFRGRKTRTAAGAVVSDRSSSKADLQALREFASSRVGVEAWVEPQTSVTQTTLLLVAHDGESIRRRVASPQAGYDFARKKLQVPVYDSLRVPVAARKREFDLRKAGVNSKSSTRTASASSARPAAPSPAPAGPSRAELAAIMTLESIAGVDPLPQNPTREQLLKVYRSARKNAHPDRTGGDRTKWDKVEDAARALGLPD